MFLTDAETDALNAQIRRLESRAGVQVVAAVVGKSDTYTELPWKAFALGAAVAALVVVFADMRWPQWATSYAALVEAIAILGAGAAAALLAIFVPPFARLFLRATRRDVEVRQHAQSIFLTRELFKTRDRTAVLIFVSVFERKVEILADVGLTGKLADSDWQAVIARMTPRLRESRPFDALQEGVTALDGLLAARGFASPAASNELPDRPIEELGG